MSATAVQRNTEAVGKRLADSPYQQIESHRQQEGCQLMVVEADGTMSPQIEEQEVGGGRKGLEAPTEYQECNPVVIDKQLADGERQRWIGDRYRDSISGSKQQSDTLASEVGYSTAC